MEGDGGENTGVPCLAVVRYAVATVVGVVAFSVVVMVITVVRRPEDIQLSIDHGYIAARGLGVPSVQVQQSNVDHGRRRLLSTTDNTANNQGDNTTLRVVFTAINSSGRGDVTCSNITGGLLDVMLDESSSSTPAMETIVQFQVDDSFDLPKESTHVQPKTVAIGDADQRRYLSERYNSLMIFKVAVMVNMYASPDKSKRHSSYTFYCWPITIGSGYSDLDSTSDVPCTKMANRDIPQLRRFPAPAPTS